MEPLIRAAALRRCSSLRQSAMNYGIIACIHWKETSSVE